MSMYSFIKRSLDIVLCSFAAIVMSPLLLLTAVIIKISSPGPVLYISKRGGKNGVPFRFYKFRSMHLTEHDKKLFVADPERLFPFGQFIRHTKIDELPQLFNVIKGDLSIVGPRPMMADDVMRLYGGKYAPVRSVKPGLTSAASLYDYIVGDRYTDNAAYEREVLPVKQELELYYVNHRSLRYDVELVLRTMIVIIQMLFGKKSFRPMQEISLIKDAKG